MLLLLQALVFHAPSNDSARTGVSPLPLEATIVANSSRPWGVNDGALWAGKGLSGSLTLGGRWRVGPLTVTLAPEVWFAQNAAFDTLAHGFANRHPLAFPYDDRIDFPQRLGEKPLARLTPGQSGVRLTWRGLTASFSTETIWWGPARRHPILLGTSAEGFPHLDMGLRPSATPAGRVEARVVWGQLSESAWFDTIPDNGDRLFAGLVLGWEPRWIPGLMVGVQRVFYQPWTDSLDAADFFSIIQPFLKAGFADTAGGNPEGNDERDQMLSLVWRFAVPGFSAYGEWARNDHNWNFRDLITQPDHAQAWNVGLRRSVASGDGTAHVSAEWLHLSRAPTFQIRAEPQFYAHHIVRQGYTHRGQLLGAGVGPGSDAQYVAFDREYAGGGWGLWFERVRWHVDAYYARFQSGGAVSSMDVTLELGGRYRTSVAGLDLDARLSLIREINRHFRQYNDVWNVSAGVGVRWGMR